MNRIFILEDELTSQMILESTLAQHELVVAKSLKEARQILAKEKFDLYLLDMYLPDGNALDLLETNLKDANEGVYLITSCTELHTQLLSFQLGVDDYIAKPFHPLILKAKLQAKLAKQGSQETSELSLGSLTINDDLKNIKINGETFEGLTKTEFNILKYLISSKNQVLSRDQILNEVIGHDANTTERTVDAHISKLRRKLGQFEKTITSVHGFGYKVEDDSFA